MSRLASITPKHYYSTLR